MPHRANAPVVVENLNHYYGKGALRRQILFDVSTVIPAGEIVIVTGPSGSGKTTLLTLVGALRAPQEGKLRVLGQQLDASKRSSLEDVRRRIGFIFQQHNLLGALTASQNVQLGLRVTGRASRLHLRQKADAMLEAVGLGEHTHKRAEQLSGGQRQRVAIARALVAEPAMVLADEPTASLDKASGREVVDRMQSLARERGTTILLVTHDNRILDVADRILHLEDGRLSTFTDAVIANTEQMMHLLAQDTDKRDLDLVVDELDEAGFRSALQEMTQRSQRFLEATAMASDEAFQSMLEQSLRAFTRRVGELLDAERASLFLVDRERQQLVLRVAQDMPDGDYVRIPLASGIAGAAAVSGEIVRVDDAYADPRFNKAVDTETGFRTRSMLCLPLQDRSGQVFAVTQLLNRRDGQPFDDRDAERYQEFAASLSVLLESLVALGNKPGRRS
ncbi:MAG: ATP-binding cassette domain-containing protein [Gammaproteobacteria bacterium]|nr:ATP-binding cassette domain-containing protein [Gammaproteobacteria bacterium]MDH5226195.1 ATP-binding cassette domain-containing protein [Gammaproteobacteria bacterium]